MCHEIPKFISKVNIQIYKSFLGIRKFTKENRMRHYVMQAHIYIVLDPLSLK